MRARDAPCNFTFTIAPVHREFKVAFVENRRPWPVPAIWPTVGRRQIVTGRPERGAPDVTETVISRTAVAESMENVAYSERLQKLSICGPKTDAPNVTETVISATTPS